MKLTAFYYKSRPSGGEDGRHILVWGRLQDARTVQTSFIEHNSQTGAMKVPAVCDGRVAWLSFNRLTALEDMGMEPPKAWLDEYKKAVGV